MGTQELERRSRNQACGPPPTTSASPHLAWHCGHHGAAAVAALPLRRPQITCPESPRAPEWKVELPRGLGA